MSRFWKKSSVWSSLILFFFFKKKSFGKIYNVWHLLESDFKKKILEKEKKILRETLKIKCEKKKDFKCVNCESLKCS